MQTNARIGGAELPLPGTNDLSQAQATSSHPAPPHKKSKDKKIWSCHSCRRRKLKCDRSDPCGACQARGEAHSCTWEEGQRPEKNNRGSLEELPTLILKLTEEINELKTSNSDFMESLRYQKRAMPLEGLSTPLSTMPAMDSSLALNFSTQSPSRTRWSPSRIAAVLPESPILWALISQLLHASTPLIGFIDVSQLVSEVEEADQIGRGMGNHEASISLGEFNVKVSLILACASLAAMDLDAAKSQELGIARDNIDAFARDLWTKSKFLITHLDFDSFTTGFEANASALPKAQPSVADSDAAYQQTGLPSTGASNLLSRVAAIKILLLLAARSFAAPSEYLKLHLDAIASAIEASLDSPGDDSLSLGQREWRWQQWSCLCVLDWTSPGIYHSGSYFIRPEMHRDPPSKVAGLSDDESQSPTTTTEQLERLSQNRYFLEYALTLANLSRRAEDCIIRPGPISPTRAAELCSELDALDHKLSFYQLLGGVVGRGGEGTRSPNHSVSGSASATGRMDGSGGAHALEEHRASLPEALQVQNGYLSLELGLIRFKLFRHETFHLMHHASTSGPLRMMCTDACMDACIVVLSRCRNIGTAPLSAAVTPSVDRMPTTAPDAASSANGEPRPFPGIFRRVIQPASSAALVGQVLLHASRSADGLGLLSPDKHECLNPPRPLSEAGGASTGTSSLHDCSYGYAKRPTEAFIPRHYNANGTSAAAATAAAAAGAWAGRLGKEKVGILQWHVETVTAELEALQATSPLARYKLALQRQCM